MSKKYRRFKISYKLLASLLVSSVIFIYVALQWSIINRHLQKQNEILKAGNIFSDAIFEAKYFLRSDMHIFTEMILAESDKKLKYWWGEHEFQIKFFNDQVVKIEENSTFKNNDIFQKYVNELLVNTKNITYSYNTEFLSFFDELRNKKLQQFNLLNYKMAEAGTEKKLSELDDYYVEQNNQISSRGIEMIKMLDNAKGNAQLILNLIKKDIQRKINSTYITIIIIIVLGLLISIWFTYYMSGVITKPVLLINKFVNKMALGVFPEKIQLNSNDEIGDIGISLNKLLEGLKKTSLFAEMIGQGKLDEDYTPLSNDDVLGNSLIEMRNSLKKAQEEEDERKREDEKRNWSNSGLTKFGDILRKYNENFKTLSFHIMSNLVKYVDAIQGAMFIVNNENKNNIYLELTSAIAFGRDKFIKKEIKIGDGLVGRAAHEKMTIHLTEIPDDYVSINSGLGDANPNTILIVPLLLNKEVLGVIELASFKSFEQYQIEFLEQLGENIASIISSVKVNVKTAVLLQESQHKSEELSAQEEEMRQNMEELQATQEEAARREEEITSLWSALNKTNPIVELDMKGKILNANDRNAEITGISKEQMIGKNHHDFAVEAKEKPEWYSNFWTDLNKGITRSRLLHITKAGKDIWIHEIYTPIRDKSDEYVKVLNIGNDITEYKARELELLEKLEKKA